VSGETGYTNPRACLGGGCTTENPDRVTQLVLAHNVTSGRARTSRPRSFSK
jgi:hypothetical protein